MSLHLKHLLNLGVFVVVGGGFGFCPSFYSEIKATVKDCLKVKEPFTGASKCSGACKMSAFMDLVEGYRTFHWNSFYTFKSGFKEHKTLSAQSTKCSHLS